MVQHKNGNDAYKIYHQPKYRFIYQKQKKYPLMYAYILKNYYVNHLFFLYTAYYTYHKILFATTTATPIILFTTEKNNVHSIVNVLCIL